VNHRSNCSQPGADRCTKAAFSLVEMLITLALVIVMVTMMYGFGSRSNQQEQKKQCQKNLQKAYIALEISATDRISSSTVRQRARFSIE